MSGDRVENRVTDAVDVVEDFVVLEAQDVEAGFSKRSLASRVMGKLFVSRVRCPVEGRGPMITTMQPAPA
jgi:hypothetical protein